MKEIILGNGKVCLVDEIDYEEFKHFNWNFREGYAARWVRKGEREDYKTKHISMHRIIARAMEGEMVDHINGNRLDNRRANLRVCTHAQNCCNMSVKVTSKTGVKGVMFTRKNSGSKAPYRAKCKVGGVVYLDRTYHTIEEAKAAYDACALKYQGDFSRS